METSEKIVVWGDSVAKGVIFDEERQRYILTKKSAVKNVAESLGVEIVNHAKMGMTIDEGFEVMKKDFEEKGTECNIGIIEFGGNDSNFDWAAISENPEGIFEPKTSVKKFVSHLTDMIDYLKEKGVRPILVTLPPVNAKRYFEFISRNLNAKNILKWLGCAETIYEFHEMYTAAITRIAKETGCRLFDLRSEFTKFNDDPALICLDGIHPSESGQLLMSKAILNRI